MFEQGVFVEVSGGIHANVLLLRVEIVKMPLIDTSFKKLAVDIVCPIDPMTEQKTDAY